MNKAILVGNLTKDPEMRTTPNGVSVTSFTVAVNRRYKSQDGQQQTDFINCGARLSLSRSISRKARRSAWPERYRRVRTTTRTGTSAM